MKPSAAEGELKKMLLRAGFDFDSPDPKLGWNVFKEFCARPVEEVDNDFLWQMGCYDFTGERLCYLDFVRQFSFSEDGEYSHMEQLHLEFTATPTEVLLPLERNEWAFGYPSLSDYFKKVESFPEFQMALKHNSWHVNLMQEGV